MPEIEALMWLSALGIATSALVFSFLGPATHVVVLPAMALLNIALLFFCILWRRDGRLPLFDIGLLCVATTTLYSFYPLLQFLLSGMVWNPLSDNRMLQYNPSATELGSFVWRHVTYLFGLCATYLLVRGRACVFRPELKMPGAVTAHMMVMLFLAGTLFHWFLLSFSNESLWVRQVSQNLFAILFLLKQGLLIFLFHRWQSRRWRYLLLVWMVWEVATLGLQPGTRTEVVLLLVSGILLYHNMVRPLAFGPVCLVGGVLIWGFLLVGTARSFGGPLFAETGEEISFWSYSNEFQALLATQFDLYTRINDGTIRIIPWQLYFSEILLLVPAQLLPFEKLNPAEWYLDVAGLRDTGFGGMFGVVSQAITGLDWIELMLRGCILGYVFACIHRWYVRHASKFWVTFFYLFLCSWSYYTYRATTFYFVYFIVYRFLPVMALVHLGAAVLRGALRPTGRCLARNGDEHSGAPESGHPRPDRKLVGSG